MRVFLGFHRFQRLTTTGVSISISISIPLGVVFMAFMAVISVGFFSFYRSCIWSLCGFSLFLLFSCFFFFFLLVYLFMIFTHSKQQRHNNCSICDMVSLSLALLSAERVFLSGYCWRRSFVFHVSFFFFFF